MHVRRDDPPYRYSNFHDATGELNVEHEHLQELIRLEETYWWHVAKRRLVMEILERHFPPPGRLVEGGLGAARNLLEFQQVGYQVTGFDVLPEAVEQGRQRGLRDVHLHDLEQPWPLDDGSVQAVVLLDVLEHLADPVQALRHVHRVLRPGGGAVVTVPAYPFLYGAWDRRLGHFRRYTARQLRTHVAEASLKLLWVSHWNAFTLPAALVIRGLDRLLGRERGTEFPRVSPRINQWLLGSARLERWWMRRTGVPCGLSLVGVMTK